ncbi:hypothetical protein L2E82_37895 [Cichorium intybus]|uniref:Uncharacterized protein n=1 Tax=Cichorium intybus TaxID=13427 RepID=A0ACB9AFW9_CICIN|nr:hypothetical protein L2E82_37895 [Cichorium intybus]
MNATHDRNHIPAITVVNHLPSLNRHHRYDSTNASASLCFPQGNPNQLLQELKHKETEVGYRILGFFLSSEVRKEYP